MVDAAGAATGAAPAAKQAPAGSTTGQGQGGAPAAAGDGKAPGGDGKTDEGAAGPGPAAGRGQEAPKPGETGPAAGGAPAYTLKAPDGFTFAEGVLEHATDLAKKLNLTQEQAQALVESLDLVPVEYKLNLPGIPADDPLLAQTLPVFKELGLSQDAAQRLMDHYTQMQRAAFEGRRAEGLAKIKADPRLGGQNLEPNIAFVGKAIRALGGENFRQWIVNNGHDNDPVLFEALLTVGQAIAEDTSAGTGGAGGAERSVAARIYPNLKES